MVLESWLHFLQHYMGDIFHFVATTIGVVAAAIGANSIIMHANTVGLVSQWEATLIIVKNVIETHITFNSDLKQLCDENLKMQEDIRILSHKIDSLTNNLARSISFGLFISGSCTWFAFAKSGSGRNQTMGVAS